MQFHHLTRTLRTASPLRSFTTSSLRLSSSPAAAAEPTPTAVDASAEPVAAAPPKLLSYYVPRTANGELPVYGDVKGMRFETICRKVDGNVEDLRKDLGEYLQDVPSFTKAQSRQVVLKGDWVREVKEWLSARGF
ncbi:mitochondrial large subunit ribosomal protein-domain-containing protein [Leucosporidium creatinivorum]|uniref:Large ribosomal subunit protein mL49 n=1 Tax=Leucosporidium creatinivorum TaxID=106004 RepID=A0A1Y2DEK8_9BASI|nr:mitochondrial large subunit ribosomal protein-domain-containing protein [Leucosporidium creatinivorum]